MCESHGNIIICRGTGHNCTCYDCIVLYGGSCQTSFHNDILDAFTEEVKKIMKNGSREMSKTALHECLDALKKLVVQNYNVSSQKFHKEYYSFIPLVFYVIGYEQTSFLESYYSVERRCKSWRLHLFQKCAEELSIDWYIPDNEED